MLRSLYGTSLKDRISTESMLTIFGMLSVNQMNAQIKLLEMRKALNVEDYPLVIIQQKAPALGVSTRAADKGRPIAIGKTSLIQSSSISDSIRVWNLAPAYITESSSLYQAKKNIKSYVRSLPV